MFPIGKLEEMVNIGTLFAFVLVSAGVIVLRRTRPDLQRGFRVPWVPLLPIAAILACLWLMLNLTGLTWIRFVIWMAIGVVVYFLYGRRHSVLGQREAAAVQVVLRSRFTKQCVLCLDSRQICLYSQAINVMALTRRWTRQWTSAHYRNSRSTSGGTRSGICG